MVASLATRETFSQLTIYCYGFGLAPRKIVLRL
jgi:hypothetical protein